LVADKVGETDSLPATLPQEQVGGHHGLDAPVEYSDKLVHRAAALARGLDDYGHTREHVLDAVVELGHQHALVLFSALALGNIDNGGQHPMLAVSLNGTETNLNWKLAPVLTSSAKIAPGQMPPRTICPSGIPYLLRS
jgi:hypothetical protein